MYSNETIKNQLNHRSIRKFKNKLLTEDEVNLLVDVARHTATSNFRQAYSIISITDENLKIKLSEIGKQKYIAEAGHLFVFVLDQRRNTIIAKEKGKNPTVQGNPERFLSAFTDAAIAAQNVVVAAESLGMGTVYLGSILNDNEKLIEILKLPKYVYPVIGLAVGWIDQNPMLKPRLPREIIHMENEYKDIENIEKTLKEYDEEVNKYYDLRNDSKPIDKFTDLVSNDMNKIVEKRGRTINALRKQGFFIEEELN